MLVPNYEKMLRAGGVLTIPDYEKEMLRYAETLHRDMEKRNQEAKRDEGKLELSMVPSQIIRDIAEVRMYGNKKYGSPTNWKKVEPPRYRDAAYRHLLAYIDNPAGVDEESGIPHIKHLACNIAFLCEMEKWGDGKEIIREGSGEVREAAQDHPDAGRVR